MFEMIRPPKYWRCAPAGCVNGAGLVCRSSPRFMNIPAWDSLLSTVDVSDCGVAQLTAPSVANVATIVRDADGNTMDALLECACNRMTAALDFRACDEPGSNITRGWLNQCLISTTTNCQEWLFFHMRRALPASVDDCRLG